MKANKVNYKVITEVYNTFCNKTTIETFNSSSLAIARFYELSAKYCEYDVEKQKSISIRMVCSNENNGNEIAVIFTGYNVGIATILSRETFLPIFEEYAQELKRYES